jgi:prephenate dehydratase
VGTVRVAFQGERGAFSEAAALRFFGPGIEPLPRRLLRDAFAAVVAGEAAYAVVPVENSHAGSVLDTYDLLLEHDLPIVGEVALPVEQCLMALPGTRLDAVRRVFSHPQALAQCEEFLRERGIEAVAVYDTAGSAKLVRERGLADAAAIAPRRAAEIYGLAVLAASIQSRADNTTRFYVVAPPGTPPAAPPDKTALALALREDDAPGALFWCLASLAYWQVNLLKIESRPSRQRAWRYLFHLDLDAAAEAPACASAIAELRTKTSFLRVLGSFPRAAEP